MLSTINKYTLYFFTFLVLFSSTIDSQEVDSKKIFKLHVNSNEYDLSLRLYHRNEIWKIFVTLGYCDHL